METNYSKSQTAQKIPIGSWQKQLPSEIMLLQGDINYTEIHFVDGHKLMVATTLKKLEKRFAFCGIFFRTHKSFLINLNYIKAYNKDFADDFVEMKNNYRVALSRRRKGAFEERIKEMTNY
jgi:DNA-binding LytR/AlgR family response regulator